MIDLESSDKNAPGCGMGETGSIHEPRKGVRMNSSDRIQNKVEELLSLKTESAWREYLRKSAGRRKVLYHYTTFANLKSILETRQWRVGRTDRSNDPAERKMYCLSFSRGLGTMAMWGNYSQPAGNGVRIKFPESEMKKIRKLFLTPTIVNLPEKRITGVMYDVAYHHPGEKNSNCLEFDGITLWGASQPWTVNESEWPCFLKSEIWRDENETRIVYECDEVSTEHLQISLAALDFSKLTFELAPDFLLPDGKRPDEKMKNRIIQEIFGELLDENRISPSQFILPPPASMAHPKKSGEDLFKEAVGKIMNQ